MRVRCLGVLMEWFVWLWRIVLSLVTVGTSPGVLVVTGSL